MSTSDTFTKQQWQDQEALHRFQLVSPLLQTGLDDARRLQLRRTIADENNISVRTLYRYEKHSSKNSLQGSGQLTVKNTVLKNFEFLLEQAIQLHKEVPNLKVSGTLTKFLRRNA